MTFRKFILILLFLFYFPLLFSQNNAIEVIYNEKIIDNPIDTSGIKPGDYKLVMFEEMEKIREIVKNINYVLRASQEEAHFTYQEFMENDANANMMNAILASSADGIFYSNLLENEFYWQVQTYEGDYYRIDSENKNNGWNITGEKKRIGNYDCYKATKKILLNNRLPIEVIAWFTPEIPFSFGPKGYGGLPGLIVALDERGFYFYAKKIEFLEQNINILKPTKGKQVSPAEFDQLH